MKFKFQNLSCAGKKAYLSFSSVAGKVSVNLSFEIGAVKPISEYAPIVPSPYPVSSSSSKISPSRRRRTLRRMESRRLFAEEAAENLSFEEKEVLAEIELGSEQEAGVRPDNVVEKPSEAIVQCIEKDTSNVIEALSEEELKRIDDEENKRIEEDEKKLNNIVEKVIISSVTEPIEDVLDVEKEIVDKFVDIGIEVRNLKSKVNWMGKHVISLALISPVNLKQIWGRRLGLNNLIYSSIYTIYYMYLSVKIYNKYSSN